MDNRWLALVVTVVVSGSSLLVIQSELLSHLTTKGIEIIATRAAALGFNPPAMIFHSALDSFALFWVYPCALRLGSLRTLAWNSLAALGAVIGVFSADYIDKWPVVQTALSLSLPAIATIGVRTRPWAVPMAALISAAIHYIEPLRDIPLYPYFPTVESQQFLWVVMVHLPYAAILIFGTTLIPKQPATAAAAD